MDSGSDRRDLKRERKQNRARTKLSITYKIVQTVYFYMNAILKKYEILLKRYNIKKEFWAYIQKDVLMQVTTSRIAMQSFGSALASTS